MLEHDLSAPLCEAGGMEAQLNALYAEREMLHDALGTADAQDIIAMVHSLEAQCNDFYQEKEQESEVSK